LSASNTLSKLSEGRNPSSQAAKRYGGKHRWRSVSDDRKSQIKKRSWQSNPGLPSNQRSQKSARDRNRSRWISEILNLGSGNKGHREVKKKRQYQGSTQGSAQFSGNSDGGLAKGKEENVYIGHSQFPARGPLESCSKREQTVNGKTRQSRRGATKHPPDKGYLVR